MTLSVLLLYYYLLYGVLLHYMESAPMSQALVIKGLLNPALPNALHNPHRIESSTSHSRLPCPHWSVKPRLINAADLRETRGGPDLSEALFRPLHMAANHAPCCRLLGTCMYVLYILLCM